MPVLLPAPAPGRICHFGDDALDTATPLVWTVEAFLPPAECAALVDRAERVGFAPAPITSAGGFEMRPEIRNNTRVVLDDPALAATLFAKIRSHVPERMYCDTIALQGLNERFRFYRYGPGERFNAHFDGSFRRDVREESVLTVMIYLDQELEGGATRFIDHDVEVQPRTGLALIFQHTLLHEGRAVRAGVKHVLRTDVMYRRVGRPDR